MTLDEYLSLPDAPTNSAFAQRCGLSGASVGRIRSFKQEPSPAAMRAIIDASGGLVTADGLLQRGEAA